MADFYYPNLRRKRRGNGSEVEEDAISLHHYCAGRKWHSWHDYSQKGFPVAIGDRLFRFLYSWDGSVYDRDTAEYITIQALDNHLGTWYEYSRFDCPLFNVRALPIHQGSKTFVYFIGQAGRYDQTGQVWVSKDLVKTIGLVNKNPGFAIPAQFHFTAGFDNVFILIAGLDIS